MAFTNEKRKQARHRKKQRCLDYLGNKCARCGVTENLQFDHIDPETKSFEISQSFDKGWNKLVEELKKCQLLCKPCHREKTTNEQTGRIPWNADETTYNPVHGTAKMYDKKKCRCVKCKAWKSAYYKKLVDTNNNPIV